MHKIEPSLICEPRREEWAALFEENVRISAASPLLSADERRRLRSQVFEAAAEFTRRLAASAPHLAIFSDAAPAENRPVIAVGHQPEIVHCGIVMKNVMLEAELQERGLRGLHVIMDVDSGDAGEFSFPAPAGSKGEGAENSQAARRSAGIAAGPPLFFAQTLHSQREIAEVFEEAAQGLERLGLRTAADRTRAAGACYIPFAGAAAVTANVAVRRHWEGAPAYVEVPLSAVLRLPETQLFFARLLREPHMFAETYNRVLDEYRRERRIENAANPFPNLHRRDERLELPFWVIDVEQGTRKPLYVECRADVYAWFAEDEPLCEAPARKEGNWPEQLSAQHMIAPRALPLSIFFRFALCDLFVHGTGGARYDHCTDHFIAARWNSPAPRSAMVSGSRYLFKTEVRAYEQAREIAEKRRDIVYHADKYLDRGFFLPAVRATVQQLLETKHALVAGIKEARASGASAAELTREMKAVDARVREIVDGELAVQLDFSARASEQELDAWFSRTYPFFMFERGELPW